MKITITQDHVDRAIRLTEDNLLGRVDWGEQQPIDTSCPTALAVADACQLNPRLDVRVYSDVIYAQSRTYRPSGPLIREINKFTAGRVRAKIVKFRPGVYLIREDDDK